MPFFHGTPAEFKQIPRFTQGQTQGINAALQQALSGLQQPLGQGYAPIAQQARTQFSQQTVPTLAERFSSLGGQGGQRSSAFPQLLGQAGAGLEGDLAAGQAQFGLQHQQLLQQLLGMGLTPQFETAYQPRQQSTIGSLLGSLAGGVGSALPMMLTGGLSGLGGLGSLGGMGAMAAPAMVGAQTQNSPNITKLLMALLANNKMQQSDQQQMMRGEQLGGSAWL